MPHNGPPCAIEDCDTFADEYIDGVMLEGLPLDIYVCGDHAEEIDERAGAEVAVR